MLKGKHYTTAGILTARICGICSIGHCLASVRATEDAFGVEVPEAAAKLRLLAKHGETLQSHVLHLFFLAAPDFLGLPSALPLLRDSTPRWSRWRAPPRRAWPTASATWWPAAPPTRSRSRSAAWRGCPSRQVLLELRDELDRVARRPATRPSSCSRASRSPTSSARPSSSRSRARTSYPFIGGRLVSERRRRASREPSTGR